MYGFVRCVWWMVVSGVEIYVYEFDDCGGGFSVDLIDLRGDDVGGGYYDVELSRGVETRDVVGIKVRRGDI